MNVENGKVEYLEVPVTVLRKPGVPDQRVYGVAVATSTVNSRPAASGRDKPRQIAASAWERGRTTPPQRARFAFRTQPFVL